MYMIRAWDPRDRRRRVFARVLGDGSDDAVKHAREHDPLLATVPADDIEAEWLDNAERPPPEDPFGWSWHDSRRIGVLNRGALEFWVELVDREEWEGGGPWPFPQDEQWRLEVSTPNGKRMSWWPTLATVEAEVVRIEKTPTLAATAGAPSGGYTDRFITFGGKRRRVPNVEGSTVATLDANDLADLNPTPATGTHYRISAKDPWEGRQWYAAVWADSPQEAITEAARFDSFFREMRRRDYNAINVVELDAQGEPARMASRAKTAPAKKWLPFYQGRKIDSYGADQYRVFRSGDGWGVMRVRDDDTRERLSDYETPFATASEAKRAAEQHAVTGVLPPPKKAAAKKKAAKKKAAKKPAKAAKKKAAKKKAAGKTSAKTARSPEAIRNEGAFQLKPTIRNLLAQRYERADPWPVKRMKKREKTALEALQHHGLAEPGAEFFELTPDGEHWGRLVAEDNQWREREKKRKARPTKKKAPPRVTTDQAPTMPGAPRPRARRARPARRSTSSASEEPGPVDLVGEAVRVPGSRRGLGTFPAKRREVAGVVFTRASANSERAHAGTTLDGGAWRPRWIYDLRAEPGGVAVYRRGWEDSAETLIGKHRSPEAARQLAADDVHQLDIVRRRGPDEVLTLALDDLSPPRATRVVFGDHRAGVAADELLLLDVDDAHAFVGALKNGALRLGRGPEYDRLVTRDVGDAAVDLEDWIDLYDAATVASKDERLRRLRHARLIEGLPPYKIHAAARTQQERLRERLEAFFDPRWRPAAELLGVIGGR
ncbi:MAG: hypothetical protein KC468_06255 [Myxococcales bacterium]|nr:hypothetical protein [Myxococcales bacterium]